MAKASLHKSMIPDVELLNPQYGKKWAKGMISNSNNSNMAKCEKRRRSASGLSDGSTGRGMSRGAEARDIAPLPSYNSSTHPPPDIDPLQIYTRTQIQTSSTRMLLGCQMEPVSESVCMKPYEILSEGKIMLRKCLGVYLKGIRYQGQNYGEGVAALNTRSVSALLTALIHVAENPLLPPGYRKEQTCKV